MGKKVNSFTDVLEPLRELGWRPGAIIDIGVEMGTTGLYSVWPDVPICLIEPSPDSLPFMEKIAAAYPHVSIFNVGASDRTAEVVVQKHETLVNIHFGQDKSWGETTVKVRPCDDMVEEAGLEPPFIYKLDTDSHEREILAGSNKTLANSELCIIEINIFNPRFGYISPNEIWVAMAGHGFTFFNIANCGFGESGVMRSADFVFVKEKSQLFKLAQKNSTKRTRLVDMTRARL